MVDTNSSWLQRRLRALGIRVITSQQVSDDPAELAAAITEMDARADLVVLTGGLGPTADDRTREVMAEVGGVSLRRCEDSLRAVREFFRSRGMEPSSSNERQADLPEGSEAIPNANGTAPGVWWSRGAKVWVALPGVPSEMRAMWQDEVEPRLAVGTAGTAWLERELRVVGLPESVVGERVAEWMVPGQWPSLAITASRDVIRLTLSDSGDDEGRSRLEARLTQVRERFELHRTIEAPNLAVALVEELSRRGETLSLAESCTGGLVAGALTEVPGSSAVLLEGCVSYSNDAKQRRLDVAAELLERHGAVSREVALAMAAGVRRHSGSTWSVSITGIAGPGGGSEGKPVGTVHFAVDGPNGNAAWQKRFPGDRHEVRQRAVWQALAGLWARLHDDS